MKKIKLIALSIATFLAGNAQTPWLHIYQNSGQYTGVPADSVASLSFSSESTDGLVDFLDLKTTDGQKKSIDTYTIDRIVHGANVPAVSIVTDRYVDEIPDKDNYLDASITVDGRGVLDDFEGRMQIKGRGNSTWKYKKKPYRVKFDKKTSMLGFKKMKNYVFLANYIDPSQMRNVMAMKVAELVGCAYVNSMVPVDVWLNGKYRGSYLVTEKVGINSTSVDVEETQSILWEMDKNYDEDWRFKSPIYKLPVMVKDPDMDCDPNVAPEAMFEKWKADFIQFESAVAEGRLADVCDIDDLARYLFVFNFACNTELEWPKSVYLYKTLDPADTASAKYHFGPIWDFDWCYGYISGEYNRFETTDRTLFIRENKNPGSLFFQKMLEDKQLMEAYKRVHEDFMNNRLDEFWKFFDEYTDLAEPNASHNYQTWTLYGRHSFREHAENLRKWIEGRLAFISTHKNYGLK